MTSSLTDTDTVDVWYTRCPVPSATGLALGDGTLSSTLSRVGASLQPLQASANPTVRNAHFDHTLPNSFRDGGSTPALWSRARGAETRLIAVTHPHGFDGLVASPESGITELAEVRGRRFGLPQRQHDSIDFWQATALLNLERGLAAVGLTVDDVEVVPIPVVERFIDIPSVGADGTFHTAHKIRRLQTAEFNALIRGEVDFISAQGAHGLDAATVLGATILHDLRDVADPELKFSNNTPITFTVSADLIEERLDVVAHYLAAAITRGRWAVEHPLETRQVIAREVGVAEEWVHKAYTPHLHRELVPGLAPEHLASLGRHAEFLHRTGFLPAPVDIDNWVDPRPLQAALDLLN